MKRSLEKLKRRFTAFLIMAKLHIRTFLTKVKTVLSVIASFFISKDPFTDCQNEADVQHGLAEISDKAEAEREKVNEYIARIDLNHEITRFKMNLILFATFQSDQEKNNSILEVKEEIKKQKDTIAMLFGRLKFHGVDYPPELESAIMDENLLSKMTNLEAAQNYCDHLDNLIDQIK